MTTTTSTSRRSSSNGTADVAARRASIRRDDRVVHVRCSTSADGDFHRVDVPFAELDARRRAFVDLPWSMLDEHHGVTVCRVHRPGEHDGEPGDVLVTDLTDAVLGCWVGDCAPVVLIGESRDVAVAHAGWRGLAAGVLDVAVATVDEQVRDVVLGPVIGPCCYEFGSDDLRAVAAGMGVEGDAISGVTLDRTIALDVPLAVAVFAERIGASFTMLGGCTGCSYPGFSHRVRRDPQRHVVAVWQERRP